MQCNSCALSIVTALDASGKSFLFMEDDAFLAERFCSARLQSVIGNCILDIVCVCVCESFYPSILSKLN